MSDMDAAWWLTVTVMAVMAVVAACLIGQAVVGMARRWRRGR